MSRIAHRARASFCLAVGWAILAAAPLRADEPSYQDLVRSAPVTAAATGPWLELRRKVRILHLNVYGRAENGCEERYRTIGRKINDARPPFDVVCLNEHFRTSLGEAFGAICDPDVLTDAIAAGGSFGKGNGQSRRHYPRSYDLLNFDGGLDVWTRHRISEFQSFPFENSGGAGEVYGFVLARIDLGEGLALDVWVTHLAANVDDCDRKCRDVQLHHFADYVHYHSGSGRRVSGGERHNPVILLGDFNIGAPVSRFQRLALEKAGSDGDEEAVERLGRAIPGNHGYQDILARFRNPVDAWLETHPESPGFTLDSTTNSILSGGKRTQERIDHVFLPGSFRFTAGPWVLKVASMEIVRWRTPSNVAVSDHHGLDLTLEVWERKFPPRPPPRPGSFRVRAIRVPALDR